ncbi:hypothetical protein GGX14DRAFT_404775 [Mycena pura]|uniref:Uncharacterized protein n=1 Tax=Mycena pura TaxID=153505 RepID=A0AAD6Y759_9AGAR|nr:hypothetical protein GGX14DRAFT_404775 [Mycena pura]
MRDSGCKIASPARDALALIAPIVGYIYVPRAGGLISRKIHTHSMRTDIDSEPRRLRARAPDDRHGAHSSYARADVGVLHSRSGEYASLAEKGTYSTLAAMSAKRSVGPTGSRGRAVGWRASGPAGAAGSQTGRPGEQTMLEAGAMSRQDRNGGQAAGPCLLPDVRGIVRGEAPVKGRVGAPGFRRGKAWHGVPAWQCWRASMQCWRAIFFEEIVARCDKHSGNTVFHQAERERRHPKYGSVTLPNMDERQTETSRACRSGPPGSYAKTE